MRLGEVLVSFALMGCEQIVGIQDPGRSSGPLDPGPDAGGEKDAAEPPDGPAAACAALPSFAPPNNFGAVDPLKVAIGDLDKNGLLDLAYADGSEVRIMLGTGGGNFGVTNPMKGSPVVANNLLIADVDDDGAQDLVTWDGIRPGHAGASTIQIHRQSATAGTFLAAQSITVPNGGRILRVDVGKLNNDTRPDLVVSSDTQGAIPYFGSVASPGTFTIGTGLAVGDGATVLDATDVDGDGLGDIVLASIDTPGVRVFFNKTATPGTFESAQTIGNGLVPNGAFGHFSANAPRKDVVLGSALFVQNAARVFTLQTAMAFFGIGAGGQSFVAIDMNGDSKDDVVAVGRMAVQCPSGGFYPASNQDDSIEFGDGGQIESQVIRDLNGDTKPDVIQVEGQFIKVLLHQ